MNWSLIFLGVQILLQVGYKSCYSQVTRITVPRLQTRLYIEPRISYVIYGLKRATPKRRYFVFRRTNRKDSLYIEQAEDRRLVCGAIGKKNWLTGEVVEQATTRSRAINDCKTMELSLLTSTNIYTDNDELSHQKEHCYIWIIGDTDQSEPDIE
ncbi:hypothetical protein BDB01DRAFT_897158 [Pilobolus umbonatus]|nr:hypothetical protein BDB01DRAFT_897158 [Pilobolus umbonatus]